MGSSRNMAVLGLSVFIGLTIPTWAQSKDKPVDTGDEGVDNILSMLLSNPNLIGTLLAFFLDNTVPGTREERGILAWQVPQDTETVEVDPEMYDEGYEVYEPLVPKSCLKWKVIKYIPFLPYRPKQTD